MSTRARAGRRGPVLALVAALSTAVGLIAPTAAADTAPPVGSPATVSADVLPTVQVNGVIWSQVVVGDRVFATGNFTSARPAGSAPGVNTVSRAHILAYDLRTGALISSWAGRLNAQGLTLAASPDGRTIYVGGDFTYANGGAGGVRRYRLAAFSASTGALVGSFAPALNARVRTLGIAGAGATLYAGGIFTTANGQSRQRLAAFNTGNGSVLSWAPKAEAEVMALVVPPGKGRVVVGGRFTTLNGVAAYGMGALSPSTGATTSWSTNTIIRNAGANSAIYSLSSDGYRVYGTGYRFGSGGNFEGSFASTLSTGNLQWVNGCRGDTYSSAPIGGVLYTVSHAHDCSRIGEFPQTTPWTFQRAMATTTARGSGTNSSGPFEGLRHSDMLHWLPTLAVGTFTGQSQAAWHVTGTSDYVLLGGEFPKINGVAQQGLARFAVRDLAPNDEGPNGYDTLTPELESNATGTVQATWTAAWDRDNRRLTYELLRGASIGSATLVGTRTVDSTWYDRPGLSLTDASAPPGTTATYRVRVTDPLGNSMTSVTATVSVR